MVPWAKINFETIFQELLAELSPIPRSIMSSAISQRKKYFLSTLTFKKSFKKHYFIEYQIVTLFTSPRSLQNRSQK